MSDPTAIELRYDPRFARISGTTTHGNMYFDAEFITAVLPAAPESGRFTLWHGGCTDGLQLPHDIRHVVSLYPWEAYKIHNFVDSQLTVRMYDSDGGADFDQVRKIADWVLDCLRTGDTLVHCQAGLNRSALVVAAVLIRLGHSPSDAIARMRETRSPAVLCNKSFERAILDGKVS